MRSKKVLKNIITSCVLQIITIICGFIVPRCIIQSFGSSVNGLITSITQFLGYITLLESGFGPVVKAILYKPIADKNKEEIVKILKASEKFFRTISYIFIAYIIVLCFVLPLILSNEFSNLFTLSLIIIIAISTFAEYYFGMTYKLYLQAEQSTYVTSIIQIGTTILNTIIIVVLIYWGANIQVVKLFSAGIFVFRPILQNIYVKKKYQINLTGININYKIKQKWEGLSQHIAYVIHSNTDIVILTLFSNTLEVSVYSVYMLVVNGVKSIVQAITGGIDASFGDMIARNEKGALNKNFKVYELIYFTVATIIFSTTLLVILPFISLYTKGITDVNYYRPTFAYLIILAEFMWTIRLPYSAITLAAGHFRQTMKGAWIESILNIILSIALVFRFGIVGVAIGTLIAMFVRSIEFMYHTSKYILERNVLYTFKKLLIIAIEIILIVVIVNIMPSIVITNYISWIIKAFSVFIISSLVIIGINFAIYKEDVEKLINIIKTIIKRKEVKKYENTL